MSLLEPRCLVCGAPLSKSAPFEKDVRNSEVCSDECYKIYMEEAAECPKCGSPIEDNGNCSDVGTNNCFYTRGMK